MAFDIEGAKKAGYSEREIEDFLEKRHPNFDLKSAKKAGYSEDEIINFLSKSQQQEKSESPEEQSLPIEQVSEERNALKSAAGSYAAGLAGGAGGIAGDIGNILSKVPGPQGKLLSQLQQLAGVKGTEELTEGLQQEIVGEQPQSSLERILQKSGEFGGQEAAIGTAFGGPVGAGVGALHGSLSGIVYQASKELGASDTAALGITLGTTLSPVALKKLIPQIYPKLEGFISKVKGGMSSSEAAKETGITAKELKQVEGIGDKLISKFKKVAEEVPKSEAETLTSGITKPKALESEHASKGLITSAQQTKAVERLNKEATELTSKAIEKHVPVAKMIEEGHDFAFNERFTNLQKIASEANPDINITSVSKFLSDSAKEYKGLPKDLLHDEAKKILAHVKTLRNQPQTEMKNLIRLFRINNKKIGDITAKRLVKGPQKEYEGFLKGLNKAIEQSFVDTLPIDSAWVNEFKTLNKEYSQVQNAKQTLNQLEGVLNGEVTGPKLKRLASNAKEQKKLTHYMGKEGAEEVIQIAKDHEKAVNSIKQIPVKELSIWDGIFPLSSIIPGFQVPGAIAATKKAVEFSRRGYGYYLTTPELRKSYDKALKAIESGDKFAYKAATETLK